MTVARPASQPLLLVVDDNEAIRYSFCRTLRTAGFQTREAGTGQDALRAITEYRPALVVLDLRLPDMSGYEVGRRIKQDPNTRHTLVLHASASFIDHESRVRALENADGYLAQPVSSEELLATVRAMLRMRGEDGNGSPPARPGEFRQELRATLGALREKNQILEALVQASPLAIAALDEEGHVTVWNDAAERTFGWQRPEIVGRALPILPSYKQAEFDEWRRQLGAANRSFVGFETVCCRENGDEFEVSISAALLADGQGRVNGLMMILQDVSDRKRSEELLRRSEKLIEAGKMAAALAHEINNPLSSVVNLIYLLGENGSMDEAGRRYLDLANEELGRVVHISKQMLGMYRESATPVRVSLAGIMDDVLDLYAQNIQLSGVKVEKHYRTRGEVAGFPGELRQAFSNVLRNALEVLNEADKRIIIHISPAVCWNGSIANPAVRVTIADSGVGIADGDRGRIFEPFFTTKGERGTGLGLWVVRGIVEKHDGTVRMRSSTVAGRSGTCFSILLPLVYSNTRARVA
jgi:two-component system NtrC family sensor kinase